MPTGQAQSAVVHATVIQMVWDYTAKLLRHEQIGIIPVTPEAMSPGVVPRPAVANDAELLIAVHVAEVMHDVPAKSET